MSKRSCFDLSYFKLYTPEMSNKQRKFVSIIPKILNQLIILYETIYSNELIYRLLAVDDFQRVSKSSTELFTFVWAFCWFLVDRLFTLGNVSNIHVYNNKSLHAT